MAKRSVCSGDFDRTFTIQVDGESYVFDSFECAIQALAPKCAYCGWRILGHPVEVDGETFCCAHCARSHDGPDLRDRSSELLSAPLAPLV
jgi:hypothetical protein